MVHSEPDRKTMRGGEMPPKPFFDCGGQGCRIISGKKKVRFFWEIFLNSRDPSWFERKPRTTFLLIFSSFLAILFLVTEVILKIFLPFSAATIGHLNSPQAMRYGWGYSPHAAIDLLDPDTGEVYQDRTNSQGWRDKERTLNINNTRKSFRIVVIGDSCTFGAIVPADKIYTRLLENKLTGKGYNVEVINISYGGWDAEQELETLKNEGLLYHPNLIILQFCTNDLGGDACSENPALSAANAKLQKPFYYRFGENGGLVRERNDYFYKVYVRSFENRLRSLVYHSEILKRLHYLSVVFRTQGVHAPRNNTVYRITNDNLLRFRLVYQLDQNDPVIASF
jgi:lysophospholipase L1-like esterase